MATKREKDMIRKMTSERMICYGGPEPDKDLTIREETKMNYVCKICQWAATATTAEVFIQVALDHMAEHISELDNRIDPATMARAEELYRRTLGPKG